MNVEQSLSTLSPMGVACQSPIAGCENWIVLLEGADFYARGVSNETAHSAFGPLATSARGTGHALRRVQLLTQFVHQLKLRLQVIDVLLLVGRDALQQHRARGVLLRPAHDDAGFEAVDDVVLDGRSPLKLSG